MGGCAEFDIPTAWNPFAKPPEKLPGVMSPAERLAILRTLTEQASELEDVDRRRITAELGRAIRSEQDPMIRAEIIRTLGAYPCEQSDRILRAALSDTDPDVRIAACGAWGKREGKEAIEALRNALIHDTDSDVRLTAAQALAESRNPDAAKALEPALFDKDPALQYRAALSLQKITGKDLGGDVGRWQEYVEGKTPPRRPVSIAERLQNLF
jgi:HEAT repeat protein